MILEGGLSKKKLSKYIEMLIYTSIQVFNDSIKGYIENHSKCPLAKASFDNGYDEFLEQITCKKKCNIATFWKKNKRLLKRLTDEDKITEHIKNKGFNDQVETLREIRDNFERGQMVKNCRKIADTIIAIEMPKNHTMLTYDRSFESLCALLNKKVNRLPSL